VRVLLCITIQNYNDFICNLLQDGGSGESGITRNESYGDDLAGFTMEALQPAANGGAKLTKDQILAGFGQGI